METVIDYINDTHGKMRKIILEALDDEDEDAEAIQALAWYDKMLERLARCVQGENPAEVRFEVAGLRAEVEALRTELKQLREDHDELNSRTETLSEFFEAYRDLISKLNSDFGRWFKDEDGRTHMRCR